MIRGRQSIGNGCGNHLTIATVSPFRLISYFHPTNAHILTVRTSPCCRTRPSKRQSRETDLISLPTNADCFFSSHRAGVVGGGLVIALTVRNNCCHSACIRKSRSRRRGVSAM